MTTTPKTLADWRATIDHEVDYVDIKPFSHNIIGTALSAIAKDFGRSAANQAIDDFNLSSKGWAKRGE